jgi:hypothetical protein
MKLRHALVAALATLLVSPLYAQQADAPAADEETPEFPDFTETVKGWTVHEGFLRLYRDEKRAAHLMAAVSAELLDTPFFLATSVAGGSPDYAGWQWEDKLVKFERLDKKLLLIELNTRQRATEGKPLAEVVRRTYADRMIASLDIESIGDGGEILVDLGGLLVGDYSTFFGSFALDSSVARLSHKVFPENVELAVTMPSYGDGTFVTIHYSISQLPPAEQYTARAADDRLGYFLTAIRDYTDGDVREGRMVRYVNRWKLEKADPELALSPPKEPIVFYVEKTVPIAYRRAVIEGIEEWNKAFEQIGIVGAIDVRQQTETQFADLDPEDVRYNFFRWITSETPFAMGPSRVDPRTGQILDADIIFDDSMLRGYMDDYSVKIREAPKKMLTGPMAERLRQHPEQHPLIAAGLSGYDPVMERARVLVRELAAELPNAKPAAEPVDRRRDGEGARCRIADEVPHQLAMARLALATMGKPGLEEQFLSEVVKETVMHEVGHTLGLRHNFKASSMLSLDTINSKAKPQALSASVMDYHPINISMVEGQPQGHFLSTTLGAYDMLAIRYGYALLEEGSDELKAIPTEMAKQGLPYGTDEDTGSPDPLITRWDLGDDPVKFADYRLAMVKALWKDLEKRAVNDGESYSRLRRALDMTIFELGQAGNFVALNVGALSFARDHRGDPNARPPIQVVPAAEQRRALSWVCENVFAPDAFEISPELLSKAAASRWSHWGSTDWSASLDYPLLDRISQVQTWTLFFVTGDETLARVWENELRASADEDALTLPELFDALEAAIFAELDTPKANSTARDPAISSARQNLQDAYVRRLIGIALGNGVSPAVANKLAWARLGGLEKKFSAVIKRNLDPYTKAHLESLFQKSKQARTAEYVHIASGGCALTPIPSQTPWPVGALALGLLGLLTWRNR